MTPKRRQGTGRAALDHITAGLTDALSTLSKVTACQTTIADVARGDLHRAEAHLEKLDAPLLDAVRQIAGHLHTMARTEQDTRAGRSLIEVRQPMAFCTCNHTADEHPRGSHCQGIDSYSQPCSCPAFERDTSDDPEESP